MQYLLYDMLSYNLFVLQGYTYLLLKIHHELVEVHYLQQVLLNQNLLQEHILMQMLIRCMLFLNPYLQEQYHVNTLLLNCIEHYGRRFQPQVLSIQMLFWYLSFRKYHQDRIYLRYHKLLTRHHLLIQ